MNYKEYINQINLKELYYIYYFIGSIMEEIYINCENNNQMDSIYLEISENIKEYMPIDDNYSNIQIEKLQKDLIEVIEYIYKNVHLHEFIINEAKRRRDNRLNRFINAKEKNYPYLIIKNEEHLYNKYLIIINHLEKIFT